MNSPGCKGIISKLHSEIIKHAMEDKLDYMNVQGKTVDQENPLDFQFHVTCMSFFWLIDNNGRTHKYFQ